MQCRLYRYVTNSTWTLLKRMSRGISASTQYKMYHTVPYSTISPVDLPVGARVSVSAQIKNVNNLLYFSQVRFQELLPTPAQSNMDTNIIILLVSLNPAHAKECAKKDADAGTLITSVISVLADASPKRRFRKNVIRLQKKLWLLVDHEDGKNNRFEPLLCSCILTNFEI